MATAFEKAGCQISAHCRASSSPAPDLGPAMSLQEMLEGKTVDVIACAAPPAVTKTVLDACVASFKPCFLSKPLQIDIVPRLEGGRGRHVTVYVDYVHLWSPLYELVKKSIRDYGADEISIWFHGRGPVRSFPGVLDYGPHALAMLFDCLPTSTVQGLDAIEISRDPARGAELVEARFRLGQAKVKVIVGNGAEEPRREFTAKLKNGPVISYREKSGRRGEYTVNDELVKLATGQDPLALMIERFLWDVEVGRANPYFLELSAIIGRTLNQMRQIAGLPPWNA